MKHYLLFVVLFITAFFLFGTIEVNASSLSVEKTTTVQQGELFEGVTFENFTGITTTDYDTEGLQNISYVKKSNSSPIKVVAYSKIDGSSIVGSDLIELAQDYEFNHPGNTVIAGINGDYYDMTTKTPINAFVQEGDVIKYNNFSLPRYFSVGFTDDASNYVRSKTNEVEPDYVLSIFDETGTRILKEIKLSSFNMAPGENETTIYYQPLQVTSIPDATMFLMENAVYLDYATLFLKGNVTGEVQQTVKSEDLATIVSTDQEIISLLEVNPQVRIQKNLVGDNLGYANIIGVGSQPLVNDEILSFVDIEDQNVDFASQRAPRSSFGFTAEGDLVIAAIDGRQTDMAGVNLREEAIIMQSLGCINSFNLDGGGSTQLLIRDTDGLRMLNSPSEVYRKVANSILFVVPDIYIDATFSNFTASTVAVDYDLTLNNGAQLLELEIFVNETPILGIDNEFVVDQLVENGINYISFVATYELNDEIQTRCFYSERINLENYVEPEPVIKVKPYDFTVEFTESEALNGFEAIINFEDPSKTFIKLYLVNDGVKKIASKGIDEYRCDFTNIEPDTEFSFQIEYYYRINTFLPVYEMYEETFQYHYQPYVPVESIDDEQIDDVTDANIYRQIIVIALVSCSFLLGVSLLIIKKRLY